MWGSRRNHAVKKSKNLPHLCLKMSLYLIVAFALPKRIQRGLAVDRRAAVAVRITSVALSRVCGALYRVRRLVYDKKIVLKRNYHLL